MLSSNSGSDRVIGRSRIGKGGRVTIPAPVRRKLRLRTGDELLFADVDGRVVLIRKGTRLDIPFLRGLESTLSEWNSGNDDRAFRDL